MTKLQTIVWRLGYGKKKRHRLVRYLYYKLSNHKWLWGIRGWLADNYIADPEPCTASDVKEAYDWIEKHADEIFQKIN